MEKTAVGIASNDQLRTWRLNRRQVHLVGHVTDGEDMRHVRGVLRVHHDRPVGGELHAGAVQPQRYCVGRAPEREEHQVAVEMAAIGQMQPLATAIQQLQPMQ